MEREDGTYELLSITSLSSRQIVTEKLGSSLIQMLVYYATLAPCIAFTYLFAGNGFGDDSDFVDQHDSGFRLAQHFGAFLLLE